MPLHPVFRPSGTALITGGASGIGLAVGRRCASHGMKVVIVDVNAENLSKAVASLKESSENDVESYQVDVSKIEEWKELKGKVEKRFGGVDFLMLNAGIGLSGGWEDVNYFQKVRILMSGGGPTVHTSLLAQILAFVLFPTAKR